MNRTDNKRSAAPPGCVKRAVVGTYTERQGRSSSRRSSSHATRSEQQPRARRLSGVAEGLGSEAMLLASFDEARKHGAACWIGVLAWPVLGPLLTALLAFDARMVWSVLCEAAAAHRLVLRAHGSGDTAPAEVARTVVRLVVDDAARRGPHASDGQAAVASLVVRLCESAERHGFQWPGHIVRAVCRAAQLTTDAYGPAELAQALGVLRAQSGEGARHG